MNALRSLASELMQMVQFSHRRSQGEAYEAMAPPKFLERIVILCFKRRYISNKMVLFA